MTEPTTQAQEAPTTDERIAAIRSRLEAATPGPWGQYGHRYLKGHIFATGQQQQLVASCTSASTASEDFNAELEQDWRNAELIANAPADLCFLLDELSRRSVSEPGEDSERLDAIESGLIGMECMGTTVRYFNAWGQKTDLFTTVGTKLTLRQVLDAAREAAARSLKETP